MTEVAQVPKVMYFTPGSPTLTIKLVGRRCKAENGILSLSDDEAAELDILMKKRPNLRMQIKRVDMEEAARKAKEHQAKQPRAAIRGPVTSVNQASAILRDAVQAQKSEALTGKIDAVNVTTSAADNKPLEVDVVNTTAPKSSLLNRLQK